MACHQSALYLICFRLCLRFMLNPRSMAAQAPKLSGPTPPTGCYVHASFSLRIPLSVKSAFYFSVVEVAI